MKKLVALFLLISSFGAHADLKLFDLIRDGEHNYFIHHRCREFFLDEDNRKLLVNQALQEATSTLEELGFDKYYFHYTNNTYPKNLIERKGIAGFEDILKYQMTHFGALDNVSGVGLYVAANPFSSATYGNNQIMLTIDQSARVFDEYNYSSKKVLPNAIYEVNRQRKGFESCNYRLQKSVIWDENGIDLVFYSYGDEWFVIFNEDIIEDTEITNTGTSRGFGILRKMKEKQNIAPLFDNSWEFGTKQKYVHLLGFNGYELDELLEQSLGSVNLKGNEKLYLAMLERFQPSDYKEAVGKIRYVYKDIDSVLINEGLEHNDNSEVREQYLEILLSGTIPTNKKTLVDNLILLSNKKDIKNEDVIKVAKENSAMDILSKEYEAISYNRELKSKLIIEFLNSDQGIFESFLPSQKNNLIFNYLIEGDPSLMPQFVGRLQEVGVDLEEWYKITSKARYPRGNDSIFLAEVIKLRPELATPSYEDEKSFKFSYESFHKDGHAASLLSAPFVLNDQELIEKLMAYVSEDYPKITGHIEPFMAYYLEHDRPEFMESHIKTILCEKIDGYKGLRQWYKAAQEDEERSARKDIWIEKCDVSWPYLW
ncbi:MAG: hypothetical protein CME64_18195 [Halobacteriovoraceae bacterium]|nr:hypothetical protein [Halobacteriovoraceae bacterium]|tara:strand:- start:26454 stop:28244 length:1791 start_codon:yes stop_codon:yes gene_type:complete